MATDTIDDISLESCLTGLGIPVTGYEGYHPMDVAEKLISLLPDPGLEVVNVFTPGLYSRRMHIPAGTLLVSKEHRTEHQYVLMEGELTVWTEERGEVTLKAPYHGVTKPGTRRIGKAHTDVVWMTFHPTSETDLEVIESKIIMPSKNPLLEGGKP